MLKDLLKSFHQLLTYDRSHEIHDHESEISFLFRAIIDKLSSSDYNTYRQYHPLFLSSLESNNISSIPYEVNFFFEYFEKLINKSDLKQFDQSILETEIQDATIDKYKIAYEKSWSQSPQARISDFNFDFHNFSENEKKEIVSLIIDLLERESEILVWDKKMVETNVLPIIALRSFLLSLNNIELFYHSIGLFSDRLASSEFLQAGRDFCEEVLISAFKDNVPELGFLHAFRFYSTTKNIHTAFFYASMCLAISLNKEVSNKFVKEVIWHGLKFFRNIKLFPWVERIYKKIPFNLSFSDYERRSIDHSYFTSILMQHGPDCPSLLLDYLNKERETILAGGFHDALPWLITLYNLKRVYPDADFSETAFGFYLNVFETIVPADTVKRQKKLIFGQSADLKNLLIESLLKVHETRNEADFVYDISPSILISNKLIEYSTEQNDFSSFMLAMILKSDYSLMFKSKEVDEIRPFEIPILEIESFTTVYDDFNDFIQVSPELKNVTILLLAIVEGKMFSLTITAHEYHTSRINCWTAKKFMELKSNNFFASLGFEETKNDDSGVWVISKEEYEVESDIIANRISFAKITVPSESESLFIIKDMELSLFPHNLFLNQSGKFISKSLPVTNILSAEWFLTTKSTPPLERNFSKSIWNPIESGDMPLNFLYSKIEKTLLDNEFEINTGIKLDQPLSSVLNIVCCHGDRNIAEIQVVSHETNMIYNLDAVIGKGRILIFIVCHSGSMKTEFFRNSVSSLMKRFIAKGYETIIAPAWAFDVSISDIWLTEFLNQIYSGTRIDFAVFHANMKVYDRFPTPAAWACLHLFGNPFLKIG